MGDLNWTDDQWRKVKDAITDSFGNASVASAVLPLFGPLPGGAETVRNERLRETASFGEPLALDGDHDAANLNLVNVTVKVQLSSEQIADESLSNALLAFRRAGNILAQAQDRVVFQGHGRGGQDSAFVANAKPGIHKGLADPLTKKEEVAESGTKGPNFSEIDVDPDLDKTFPGANAKGVEVVTAVVKAIRRLENRGHSLPFACVLGNELFEAVQQPSFAFVLPSDRITPLLKGPLARSGQMDEKTGIVVSLGSNAVDVVVGTPPTVQFLQRTEEAKFLFRAYTRFALRIRDKEQPPFTGFTIASKEDSDAHLKALKSRLEVAQNAFEVATTAVTDAEAKIAKDAEAEAKAAEEAEENKNKEAGKK